MADLGLSWKSLGWWWRVAGQMAWWWNLQDRLKKGDPLEFNFVGESNLAYFIPALKVIGAPMSIARGREVDCGCSWSSCLRIFVLVFVVFLGLISLYSFELGFGVIVVPWL